MAAVSNAALDISITSAQYQLHTRQESRLLYPPGMSLELSSARSCFSRLRANVVSV